jgi:hypothetical protein
MKRFKLVSIAFCCLVLIAGAVLAGSASAAEDAKKDARKCYTVPVFGPEPLPGMTVYPGDCIIFVNNLKGGRTPESEIKVVYKAGEHCQKGVQSSLGFAVDKKQCFASGWLRPAETATIVFSTPGVYIYEIQFGDGGISLPCRIKVEAP